MYEGQDAMTCRAKCKLANNDEMSRVIYSLVDMLSLSWTFFEKRDILDSRAINIIQSVTKGVSFLIFFLLSVVIS